LNMLESYAFRDHREIADQAKKACIRIPAFTVRNGNCRVDEHSDSTSDRFPSGRRSALAERIEAPSFLF